MWIVEVDQDDPGDPDRAAGEVTTALDRLRPDWHRLLRLGAVPR